MVRRSAPPAGVVESPLMTAQEVMAYLKCSRAFLTERGADMGALKLGGLWRIRRADLEAWIAGGRKAQEPIAAEQPEPRPIRSAAPLGKGPINPVTQKPWG